MQPSIGAPSTLRVCRSTSAPRGHVQFVRHGIEAQCLDRVHHRKPAPVQEALVHVAVSDGHVQHWLPLCFVRSLTQSPVLTRSPSRQAEKAPALTLAHNRTIHSLQPKRNEYKILGGTKENPKLNSPNGHASTPLFEHLGSSSWHSWDAAVIVWFGHITVGEVLLIAMAGAAVLYRVPNMIIRMQLRARFRRWWLGRRAHYKQLSMDIV